MKRAARGDGGKEVERTMEYEILRGLFMACTETPDNGFQEGLNLSELYDRIGESREKDREFSRVLSETGLDEKTQDMVEYACTEVCDAYELQGFINGFRICGLLQKEESKWTSLKSAP